MIPLALSLHPARLRAPARRRRSTSVRPSAHSPHAGAAARIERFDGVARLDLSMSAILGGVVTGVRWQRDSSGSFAELVEARLDACYRLASVLLGDRLEAEDATHDAMLRAQRSWQSLGPGRRAGVARPDRRQRMPRPAAPAPRRPNRPERATPRPRAGRLDGRSRSHRAGRAHRGTCAAGCGSPHRGDPQVPARSAERRHRRAYRGTCRDGQVAAASRPSTAPRRL